MQCKKKGKKTANLKTSFQETAQKSVNYQTIANYVFAELFCFGKNNIFAKKMIVCADNAQVINSYKNL